MTDRSGDSGASPFPFSGVLQAKLRPAANPEYLVPRPRLHELLDDVGRAPLTLVVAPAGSGKTALLRSWCESSALPHAWLSLDETDRDPMQLWLGIVAALEQIAPGCAAAASAGLRHPDRLAHAVGALLDDLESREYDARVLVVDDLQLVDEVEAIAASLAIFVQHLPPWLHVVVASRRTPHLPIHRLRARGQLGEVRFAELRFSLDEASAMLERLAPDLPPDQVAEVASRAGGWAASIQLAALAARANRAQAAVEAPTTDDGAHYLEDYVWREVLANESTDVVEVLLACAVVDRVDPALARVLAERDDAPELLERAEERGLFTTRIDPLGAFQIHALVREVLVSLAAKRDPDRLEKLHTLAAEWYESVDQVVPALEHWLRADRPREALRLLWQADARLYDSGRESTILRTMEAIPASVAATDAESMIAYAWCHLLVDRQQFLHAVDYVVAGARDEGPVHRAQLLVLRAIAATMRGSWPEAVDWLREALDLLGETWMLDPLGQFAWNMVAREIALDERWDDTGPEVRAVQRALSVTPERRLGFEGVRAVGAALAGHPVDALRIVAGAGEASAVSRMTILRAELSIAEAVALQEIGDPTALVKLVETAEARFEPVPYANLLAWLHLVQARIDHGDLDGARVAFGRATEIVDSETSGASTRGWLARHGVALSLAEGDLAAARGWAAQVTDPFWSGLCSARVLLALDEPGSAGDALKSAEPRSVHHHVLRELLWSRSVGDRELAESHLMEAVQVAVAHGLVQTLASEGPAVVESVERLAWRAPEAWLDRLRRAAVPTSTVGSARAIELVERLTERELEVLRLLPSRLTLREVADELFISLNTLKFHLKVIYRKLDCGSRGEAAEIARTLASLRRPVSRGALADAEPRTGRGR